MITAQKILKMIENVSLNDTAKMDEIDDLVHEYMTGVFPNRDYNRVKKYTRSRDALKAIRPDVWVLTTSYITGYDHSKINGYHATMRKNGDSLQALHYSDSLYAHETEELAELHAIIQAIDYERTKNEGR